MPKASESKSKSGISTITDWLGQVQTLLAGVIALVGLLPKLLPRQLLPDADWLPWAGLVLTAGAALWLIVDAHRRWTRRADAASPSEESFEAAQIRGPRPFEDGDELLGRGRETAGLFVIVRSLDFRFGYVSGEAGAGKTSLLRAALARRVREKLPDWTFVYVPRSGGRPDLEMASQVKATLAGRAPDAGSLSEICSAILPGLPGPLFIVCDQFEEFFITSRSTEARKPVADELRRLWDLSRQTGKVRVLISLRKEFVDDLLSLASELPELRLQDWRYPVANFQVDVAKKMLDEIVERGELRLSPQLRARVVQDLARDGTVRPVEFQIVLSRMQEQDVYELPAYEERGGARGIISRFVAETIEPPDRQTPEIDRQVARHLLRSLCAEDFSARRPTGLTTAELAGRITQQLRSAAGGTSFGADAIGETVERVAKDLKRAWVLVDEEGGRLNLAHDYLAASVRDATADIETAEERANRLLDQYLAQSRLDRSTTVPMRSFSYMRRYASRDAWQRTEAKALMRRSKRRYAMLSSAAILVALAAITVARPPGWRNVEVGRVELAGRAQLSSNRLLAATLKNGHLVLYDLRTEKLEPIRIPLDVDKYRIAPSGASLLALDKKGVVHSLEAARSFRPRVLFRFKRPAEGEQMLHARFSQDGVWMALITPTGELYAWPRGGQPRRVASLGQDPGYAAVLEVSATGRYLLWEDSDGQLRLFDPRRQYQSLPAPFGRTTGRAQISRDERLIAWPDRNRVLVKEALSPRGTVRVAVALADQEASFTNPKFSPDSRWLMARTRAGLYSWRAGTGPATRPAISAGAERQRRGALVIEFDPSGKFALGKAGDEKLYLWTLGAAQPNERAPILASPTEDDETSMAMRERATFCPQSPHALVSVGNGMLSRISLADRTSEPVQRLTPGTVRFVKSANDDTIIVYNATEIATGHCGKGRLEARSFDSTVDHVALSPDRSILVFDRRHITKFKRSFVVWGMSLKSRPWPDLQPSD